MAKGPEDEERYFAHLLALLSVAAAMVGVCLTALGLVSIVEALQKVEVLVDDLLAVAALLFAAVSLLSFLGIRTRIRKFWRGFSLTLDFLFCLGLITLVIASILLAWVVI